MQISGQRDNFALMNSEKSISVAFTGHRTYAGEADAQLRLTLRQLYDEGYRCFVCGMAWGWDLAAGEAVIELKNEHPEIELVAVVPFADFRTLFHDEDLEQYDRVAGSADRVVVSGDYTSACNAAFRQRNDYLVDNASLVVAWYDNKPRSGTAYTIRQARRKHIPVINLMPRQQLSLEF